MVITTYLYIIHSDIRLIVLTVDLREPIVDSFLQLTHNGLASFLIPRSVLEAAQSGGYLDCMNIVYHMDICF